MSTRIYVVDDIEAAPPKTRLIRAGSASQAIRYVVRDRFEADVAGQNALVTLLGRGVQVEDATVSGNQQASEEGEQA